MPSTFQSRPVLDVESLRPNWDEVSSGQLDDNTFDALGAGAGTPWKTTGRVKRKARFNFIPGSRAEITALRQWILARKTRLESFWMPLDLNDYGLKESAAALAMTLTINRIGLKEKFDYGRQFQFLALINETKLECYEIASVDVTEDSEIITLTTGLLTACNHQITGCCGLMLSRLADDEIEFQFLTDTIARVTLPVVECPMEIDSASETSAPIFLYRLTRGETEWRFTNWPENVTAASLLWEAANIDHGSFTQNSEFSLDPLSLEIGTDDSENPFRVPLDRNISEVTDVEIFETDFDTLTVDLDEPFYRGRLGKCSFNDKGTITAELSSIFRIAEQNVPTAMVQRPCGNRLFDNFCALNPEDFLTTGTIIAVSDDPPYIEATEFGDKATAESDDDWFALGKVTCQGEVRFCTGQDGNRLYLNAKFRTAQVGIQADALAGCDKRATTCVAKFDNIVNFFGFSIIPNKAPQFEQLSSPRPTGGKK